MSDSDNDLHRPILWGLGRYTVVIQSTWHQRYTWDIVAPHDQTPFATGSACTVAEALRQATTAVQGLATRDSSSLTAAAVQDG